MGKWAAQELSDLPTDVGLESTYMGNWQIVELRFELN